jgi:hypothetical protein
MLSFIRKYFIEGIIFKENTICTDCELSAKYCIKPLYCFYRHQYCYGCVNIPKECKICKYFLQKHY